MEDDLSENRVDALLQVLTEDETEALYQKLKVARSKKFSEENPNKRLRSSTSSVGESWSDIAKRGESQLTTGLQPVSENRAIPRGQSKVHLTQLS
jgi:uncharacterized protein (DUF736 family)